MEYSQLPGLVIEPLPSGNKRFRVRVEGDHKTRISIPSGLSDDDFRAAYEAARQGIETEYRYKPTLAYLLRQKQGFLATVYRMLSRAKLRSQRKGLTFSLTTDDVLAILDDQDGKCAVSGMLFDVRPHPRRGAKQPFNMSLDRIDNRAGYTRQNVRVTTIMVNTARLDWSDADFYKMCAAVVRTGRVCPTPVPDREDDFETIVK